MKNIIDNLDGLNGFRKVLLLYSGGVDSTYALLHCLKNNIEVVAFRGIDSLNQTPDRIKKFLAQQNVKLVEKDSSLELVESFISKGILTGGFYQNRFPISSSYTRPLIAKYATTIAIDENCECIIHTSNFHQNSAARFNNAVMHFAPNLPLAIPYINSTVTREEKLKTLFEAGYEIEGSIYSIDQNLWCRVIENGDLDDIKNPTKENHFLWTRYNANCNDERTLSLGFMNGLPVSINGVFFKLKDLISELNNIGKILQIGRFNGLEDTPLGLKNHEVREAPAAEIIHKAKSYLESAILTQTELRLKLSLDYRWTELVVNGNWYSLEKNSIDAAIKLLNQPLNGVVHLHLSNKNVFPAALETDKALDFFTLEDEINQSKSNFSYGEYYHLNSIHNKIRN